MPSPLPYRLGMRILPLLALLGVSGCVTTTRRHVFVPNTPEAAKCWRDCKLIATTCRGPTPGYLAKFNTNEDMDTSCEEERKDCLLTCPGARETTAGN